MFHHNNTTSFILFSSKVSKKSVHGTRFQLFFAYLCLITLIHSL
ncbi:hypothetical protein HMPREF9441_01498 [Paraprevotella clara YIT 11840]|uniref:Uncharacterized protein n=1 Tax=Paraprevotella clara YIT 11840 TaxID=762968 RepID=G5SQ62_9BACT|nr:hypothetical protein HMPREF9441_01498 [Paraprevotella clara YIT 11840]